MFRSWFDSYVDEASARQETQFIFYLAVFFLLAGITFLVLLLISRVRKTISNSRSASLRQGFQAVLNSIIIHDSPSKNGMPMSAFEFYLDELRKISGNSAFARDVLISQIISIKKNLSGTSADILYETYQALGLEKDSKRKLKSLEWKKKAQGIRELGEMNVPEGRQLISRFLNSFNPTLREESFMALARLQQENPLSFLGEYKFTITPWMQLNIHSFLQKQNIRTLPEFKQWFSHENKSVRLFSMNMATQFRQNSSISAFGDLITDADPEVRATALRALTQLEAHELAGKVIAHRDLLSEDKKVLKEFIICLGKISDDERTAEILSISLHHTDYEIRYQAALSLKQMGSIGERALENFNQKHDGKIQTLLQHLNEPLLA